jgi:putative phage-type endonuclease
MDKIIMNNKQWHEQRLNGIGGSEVSIVLGLNPWQSRLELWNTKVNRIIKETEEDNLIFEIGHALEPIIANHYQKMTNRQLEVRPQKIHPKYPFINGNVDREIVKSERSEPGILEIKTRGALTSWHDDEIPPYYIAQLQQYLAVYGYNWGSFAVLDLKTRKVTYTDIERDDELINHIIEEEKKFWELVQSKTPPTEEPTKACESFLKKHYNTSKPVTIDISDNEVATAYAIKLNEIKLKYKELEATELECKTYFMNRMKEAEKAIGINFSITWKSPKDKTVFDMEKFKLDHPKLYKDYTSTEPSTRRFTFKYKE